MGTDRLASGVRVAGVVFALLAGVVTGCQTEAAKPSGQPVPAGVAAQPMTPGPAAPADPSLKGYWTFDEGQGDKAANAAGPQAGKVPAGLTWANGRKGKALLFNNKDVVLVPHAPYFNAPNYTIAAWVKLKNTRKHQYVFWKNGPVYPEPKNARRLDLWLRDDGVVQCIIDVATGKEEDHACLIGQTMVADDRWHHLALTFDGKVLTLYVDGSEESNVEMTIPLAQNEHDLWIGARPGGIAATGIIDDVRYYIRALDAKQVAALAAEK